MDTHAWIVGADPASRQPPPVGGGIDLHDGVVSGNPIAVNVRPGPSAGPQSSLRGRNCYSRGVRAGLWLGLCLVVVSRSAVAWELSDERGIDEPVPTPSSIETLREIASFGDEWLIASTQSLEQPRFLVSRFDVDGDPIDLALDVPLPLPGRAPYILGVATGPDLALVAWLEADPIMSPEGMVPWTLRAARYDRTGALLDPDGIPIAENVEEPDVEVAWNGTDFLLLWDDGSDPTSTFAVRVGADGRVRDDPPIPIASQVVRQLACSASACLALLEAPGLFGLRIDPDGVVLDDPPIEIAPGGYWGAVASDGDDFLVAYKHDEGGVQNGPIRAVLVGSDGMMRGAPGPDLSTDDGVIPAAYFDGTTYLVAFSDLPYPDEVGRAVRIDTAGQVLDPEPIALPLPVNGSSGGACRAGSCLLEAGSSAFFLANGVAGELFPIDLVANSERAPAAATDGEGFLVVWSDDRESVPGGGGRLSLEAIRIGSDGVPIGSQATLVGRNPSAFRPASVAWDGAAYRIAWIASAEPSGSSGTLLLGGVAADGSALEPVTVDDIAGAPVVACGACGCLLVWNSFGLRAAPVTDGIVGASVELGGDWQATRVVPLGSGFLVAHAMGRVVVGQLLDEDAAIVDAVEIAGATTYEPSVLAVASGGASAEVLIAQQQPEDCFWQDPCCVASFDLDAVRVTADGPALAVADPVRLETHVPMPRSEAATFDGSSFVLAWTREVSCGPPDPGRVRVARLGTDGVVLEGPDSFPDLASGSDLAFASNDAGRTVIAYDRFDPVPPFDARRVRVRTLEPAAAPLEIDPPLCPFPPPSETDAGSDADAGTSLTPESDGCGCRASGDGGGLRTIWIAALAILARRRSGR